MNPDRIKHIRESMPTLIKDAEDGNEKAIRARDLAGMYSAHPDHPTLALFEAAFDDWEKEL